MLRAIITVISFASELQISLTKPKYIAVYMSSPSQFHSTQYLIYFKNFQDTLYQLGEYPDGKIIILDSLSTKQCIPP